MIRRPPRSTLDRSSAASDVYKRQDEEPFGEHNLLLIAAAQSLRDLFDAVAGHAQFLSEFLCAGSALSVPKPPRSKILQAGGGDILRDRHVEKQSRLFAVLRQIGETGSNRIAWRVDPDFMA